MTCRRAERSSVSARAPGVPTVLLYAHYDVQPPGRTTRGRRKPFEPTERDGRMYGRGAADDKCGRRSCTSVRIMALGDDCPVGVKVLIEGQEEDARDGWHRGVRARERRALLKATSSSISDVGELHPPRVPTLTTSLRGMAALDVEVETLAGAVHSGMFGGVAPDAYIALTRMLATLHDEAGDVAVKGMTRYDYPGADYDEATYRADAGVLDGVGLIGTGTVAERSVRPAVDHVIGVDVPPVEGAANALIPKARARVSIRLAPGVEPDDAQKAVKAHLEAVALWNVKVTVTPGAAGEGFLAKTDGPAYAAAGTAMTAAYSKDVVHYGEGGSIPLVAAFLGAIPGAELITSGARKNPSAEIRPNESVSIDELERCILAEALFIAGMAGQK